jgi:hypothetical protein
LFATLKGKVPASVRRTASVYQSWIQADTWKLIDERAQGRRQGTLTSGELRFLNRKIRKLIWRDRKKRTEDAGTEIEALLEDNLEGAWAILKRWYKSAAGRAPKPLQADLKAITESYRELFRHRDLSDTPLFDLQELPSFDPIDDTVPSEDEIEDVVKH